MPRRVRPTIAGGHGAHIWTIQQRSTLHLVMSELDLTPDEVVTLMHALYPSFNASGYTAGWNHFNNLWKSRFRESHSAQWRTIARPYPATGHVKRQPNLTPYTPTELAEFARIRALVHITATANNIHITLKTDANSQLLGGPHLTTQAIPTAPALTLSNPMASQSAAAATSLPKQVDDIQTSAPILTALALAPPLLPPTVALVPASTQATIVAITPTRTSALSPNGARPKRKAAAIEWTHSKRPRRSSTAKVNYADGQESDDEVNVGEEVEPAEGEDFDEEASEDKTGSGDSHTEPENVGDTQGDEPLSVIASQHKNPVAVALATDGPQDASEICKTDSSFFTDYQSGVDQHGSTNMQQSNAPESFFSSRVAVPDWTSPFRFSPQSHNVLDNSGRFLSTYGDIPSGDGPSASCLSSFDVDTAISSASEDQDFSFFDEFDSGDLFPENSSVEQQRDQNVSASTWSKDNMSFDTGSMPPTQLPSKMWLYESHPSDLGNAIYPSDSLSPPGGASTSGKSESAGGSTGGHYSLGGKTVPGYSPGNQPAKTKGKGKGKGKKGKEKSKAGK